jgi:hypothetical protein
MKKLKTKQIKFSSSERKKIKDIIRTSLRTDVTTQTVMKGPIKFVNQNVFNLKVTNPKARQKLIRTLKKLSGPMQLVVRFKGPIVIGVKRMTKSKKVLNPITGKYILIDGVKCKRMIKEGFTIHSGVLRPPKGYLRKNRKSANLILLTRKITQLKDKMNNEPNGNKPSIKNAIDKLEKIRATTNMNDDDQPLLKPSELPRANKVQLTRNNSNLNPIQIPRANTVQLTRNNSNLNPIQIPRANKVQLTRNNSNLTPIQIPRANKVQLTRNNSNLNPIQIPRANKVQLTRNSNQTPMNNKVQLTRNSNQTPMNNKVREPMWRKALSFVNPARMFRKSATPSQVNPTMTNGNKRRRINERLEKGMQLLQK